MGEENLEQSGGNWLKLFQLTDRKYYFINGILLINILGCLAILTIYWENGNRGLPSLLMFSAIGTMGAFYLIRRNMREQQSQ